MLIIINTKASESEWSKLAKQEDSILATRNFFHDGKIIKCKETTGILPRYNASYNQCQVFYMTTAVQKKDFRYLIPTTNVSYYQCQVSYLEVLYS